jgi:hypothetical protein
MATSPLLDATKQNVDRLTKAFNDLTQAAMDEAMKLEQGHQAIDQIKNPSGPGAAGGSSSGFGAGAGGGSTPPAAADTSSTSASDPSSTSTSAPGGTFSTSASTPTGTSAFGGGTHGAHSGPGGGGPGGGGTIQGVQSSSPSHEKLAAKQQAQQLAEAYSQQAANVETLTTLLASCSSVGLELAKAYTRIQQVF